MSVKLLSRLSRAQLSKACCRSLYSSSAVLPSRLQPLTAPEESDRQCSGFYRAQQSRAFAASGLSDPGPSLDEAIQQELEYEQSTDGSGEGWLPEPPKGWTLTEQDGGATINLAKQYNGEQIIVTSNINPEAKDLLPGLNDMAEDLDDAAEPSTSEQLQEDEQEDGLLDPQLTLTFEVQIGKRGDNLRISGMFDGEFIGIQHVGHGEKGEEIYDGPDYSTLDPSLQQAFVAYLEQRGINTEFGEFLMAAHEGKEHKEYMSWLSRVQSFLGRK